MGFAEYIAVSKDVLVAVVSDRRETKPYRFVVTEAKYNGVDLDALVGTFAKARSPPSSAVSTSSAGERLTAKDTIE